MDHESRSSREHREVAGYGTRRNRRPPQPELLCSETARNGRLAPKVPPEHLDGVQPRDVDQPAQQLQTARRRAHDRLELVAFLGGSAILGHVDGTVTMGAYVATPVARIFYA